MDKDIEDLSKKLDRIEMEKKIINDNGKKEPTREKQKAEDRERYQLVKKDYTLHDESLYLHNTQDSDLLFVYLGEHCNSERCVIECPYFPPEGYLTDKGIVYYDDANLMPGFYGTRNALETRRKLAAELGAK